MSNTHAFQAETRQLLDLVIHSLYSKKEIFLRELISNASDAIDRAQYEGLTDKAILADSPTWRIGITLDKDAKTLTLRDNGIGMTEAEMVEHLGTIARSGTKRFLQSLKEKEETNAPELIGQFGVGFYAAFMVADKVTVVSKRRGHEGPATQWQSTGDGGFTTATLDAETPAGTTLTLHLREGMDEFLDAWKIRQLVRQYSDFIAYPIHLEGESPDEPKDEKPLNTMRALWKRAKSEVTDDEYAEFYKHLTHDHEPPAKTLPIAAEGVVEFRALLFIPKNAPYDLFNPTRKNGLHLYVRNVFIGADFEALLPEYLRFVRGVVESSDLPLNVSREILQDDAVIRKIRNTLVTKLLAAFADMKKDDIEAYKTFYAAFGRVIKEGLHTDWGSKDKIKDLLLFNSARLEGNPLLSLREYKDAMPSSQKDIYYLAAEDLATAKASPHLEAVLESGCDALLFTDPIDAYVAPDLNEYDGAKLVALDAADFELGTDDERKAAKKKQEAAAKELKPLLDALQPLLDEEVREIRVSPRLTESACCLVGDDGMNPMMARMMAAMGQEMPKQKRVLEINPNHPVIQKMKAMPADDAQLKDYADLLLGQAQLAEGRAPANTKRFTQLLAALMAR
ncbi:MAG: molecular chaperone HtpG [Kiritimatiellaeota bacterium]|nr:molecular chaperone HtpG [Kiritimatiellota bacterium]